MADCWKCVHKKDYQTCARPAGPQRGQELWEDCQYYSPEEVNFFVAAHMEARKMSIRQEEALKRAMDNSSEHNKPF